MPASEVMGMIQQGLRAMVIGVTGVFSVLGVFYIAIKLFSMGAKNVE